MPLLEVRPEAELDALETASWYDGEREGLGTEFLAELRATFARIGRTVAFSTRLSGISASHSPPLRCRPMAIRCFRSQVPSGTALVAASSCLNWGKSLRF